MVTNIICFVVGKTGSGKSYLLNHILHKELITKRRSGMVILDLRGDHLNLLDSNGFFYLRISANILRRYKIDWEGIIKKYPYLIVEPYKLSMEEYGELADDIAGGVVETGDRVFVLEEAAIGLPIYSSNRRNMSVLVTTGRGLGIDFYFTSQRPASVNTTAVAEANVRVCFPVDDINDVKRMKGYFPDDDLSLLKRFEFIALNTFTHEKIKSDTYHLPAIDKIIW